MFITTFDVLQDGERVALLEVTKSVNIDQMVKSLACLLLGHHSQRDPDFIVGAEDTLYRFGVNSIRVTITSDTDPNC